MILITRDETPSGHTDRTRSPAAAARDRAGSGQNDSKAYDATAGREPAYTLLTGERDVSSASHVATVDSRLQRHAGEWRRGRRRGTESSKKHIGDLPYAVIRLEPADTAPASRVSPALRPLPSFPPPSPPVAPVLLVMGSMPGREIS